MSGKWKKPKLTWVINKSSAPYFVNRFTNAIWELENTQLALQADREVQIATVERYKDADGKRFEKAQRAALKGDQDAKLIAEIERRKKLLLTEFVKVWTAYTGDKESAVIIVQYLKSHGNLVELNEKYGQEKVEKALAWWLNYVNQVCALSLTRYRENKAFMSSELRDFAWWLSTGETAGVTGDDNPYLDDEGEDAEEPPAEDNPEDYDESSGQ